MSFAMAREGLTDPRHARVTVGRWSLHWLTAKAPVTEIHHSRVAPVDLEDLYLASMGSKMSTATEI